MRNFYESKLFFGFILFSLLIVTIFFFFLSLLYKGPKGDQGRQGIIGFQGSSVESPYYNFRSDLYRNLDLTKVQTLSFFSNQFVTFQNNAISGKVILDYGWDAGTIVQFYTGNLNPSVTISICSKCKENLGNVCDNQCLGIDSFYLEQIGSSISSFSIVLKAGRLYTLLLISNTQGDFVDYYFNNAIN